MKHHMIYLILVTSMIGGVIFSAVAEDGHPSIATLQDVHDHETKGSLEEHAHGDINSNHSDLGSHDGHENHGDEDEHEAHGDGSANLNAAQLKNASIRVEPLRLTKMTNFLSAPGEVLFNTYRSKKITPRISAQVTKRHKKLGEEVKKGQVLVSLSSVEMAQAQGELIVADREWQRVKKLGSKVVSDRRYVETQIAQQQAYAKVSAFGMTKSQIRRLLRTADPSKAVGHFNLLASQHGTITSDDFVEGEIVETGQVLFEITDEATMWVEARLTPHDVHDIKIGSEAVVNVNGHRVPAKVIQVHHKLDEATRTIAVRLEVENLDDELHPGLFAQAQIKIGQDATALALPINAVLRSPEGNWVVFVEEKPGEFKPKAVEVLGQSGDLIKIGGIEAGTRVVTKGAFFVQSEIAKSGFEVHNH